MTAPASIAMLIGYKSPIFMERSEYIPRYKLPEKRRFSFTSLPFSQDNWRELKGRLNKAVFWLKRKMNETVRAFRR